MQRKPNGRCHVCGDDAFVRGMCMACYGAARRRGLGVVPRYGPFPENITVAMTEGLKAKIKARADAAGESLSVYCRKVLAKQCGQK